MDRFVWRELGFVSVWFGSYMLESNGFLLYRFPRRLFKILYIFQAISLENRIMDRFVWRELGFVWFYGFAKLFSSEQYGKTGALAKKITRQLGS